MFVLYCSAVCSVFCGVVWCAFGVLLCYVVVCICVQCGVLVMMM